MRPWGAEAFVQPSQLVKGRLLSQVDSARASDFCIFLWTVLKFGSEIWLGWYPEGPMQVYEIRVLSSSSEASTIMEAMYASDFAAIRAACNMAGDNRHEVWRGLDCIYGKYCEPSREIC